MKTAIAVFFITAVTALAYTVKIDVHVMNDSGTVTNQSASVTYTPEQSARIQAAVDAMDDSGTAIQRFIRRIKNRVKELVLNYEVNQIINQSGIQQQLDIDSVVTNALPED